MLHSRLGTSNDYCGQGYGVYQFLRGLGASPPETSESPQSSRPGDSTERSQQQLDPIEPTGDSTTSSEPSFAKQNNDRRSLFYFVSEGRKTDRQSCLRFWNNKREPQAGRIRRARWGDLLDAARNGSTTDTVGTEPKPLEPKRCSLQAHTFRVRENLG